MNDIRSAKKEYELLGRIDHSKIDKNISVSWHRSKLSGLEMASVPAFNNINERQYISKFSEYCDAIIPQHIDYLLVDDSGVVQYKRSDNPLIYSIRDVSERYIGTNGGGIAIANKNHAVVSLEEHYLDQFVSFTSRGIYIKKGFPLVVLFYYGTENGMLYHQISQKINDFVEKSDRRAFQKQKVSQNNTILSYLQNQPWFQEMVVPEATIKILDHEIHKKVQTGMPLLVKGAYCESISWYISSIMKAPAAVFSGKGMLKKNQVIYFGQLLAHFDTIIVRDLEDIGKELSILLCQMIDEKIKIFSTKHPTENNDVDLIFAMPSGKAINATLNNGINKLGISTIMLPVGSVEASELLNQASTLKQTEEVKIINELKKTKWNISKAARNLGIGRATLYRKIKLYHIEKNK